MSHEIVVTKTLRWHLRTKGAKEGLSPEAIRTFLLLVLLAAIQPGAAAPRIGWWALISAQSSLDPPNRLSITPLHDGVHVVMSGETHLDFTGNWNGYESSGSGNL